MEAHGKGKLLKIQIVHFPHKHAHWAFTHMHRAIASLSVDIFIPSMKMKAKLIKKTQKMSEYSVYH